MSPVKKSQSCYIVDIPASKEVIAPTVCGLKVGAVDHAFLVQHSRENPTHKLDWDSRLDVPFLSPRRWVDVNEEFTFDYGYGLPDAKDYESEDDSCLSEDTELEV